MKIFDWFKRKKGEGTNLKGFKQCDRGHFYDEKYDSCTYCSYEKENCDCGKVWCNSCQDQHKRCECGKFFHKNFYICPYCHDIEIERYNVKKIEEFYSNGKVKLTGTLNLNNFHGGCTSWGGPLDCRVLGRGCPECIFVPDHDYPTYKEGYWKYYYENGNLCNEGKYLYDKREGEWKLYDDTGKLTDKITYKNGEVVEEST